jgi:hypothetical protein
MARQAIKLKFSDGGMDKLRHARDLSLEEQQLRATPGASGILNASWCSLDFFQAQGPDPHCVRARPGLQQYPAFLEESHSPLTKPRRNHGASALQETKILSAALPADRSKRQPDGRTVS